MSAITKLPRFAVFVFDALRRDMISAQHMPNLRRFIDEGCDFPSSRCAFPSATRVNAAALACGAVPSATGVIANRFFDPRVYVDKLFHSGRHDDMQAAERAYGGEFVTAPTLGDVLFENSGAFSTLCHRKVLIAPTKSSTCTTANQCSSRRSTIEAITR